MPLGDLDGLSAITLPHARTLRARLDASGMADRAPLLIETSAVRTPEELRAPLARRALEREGTPAATVALLFLHGGAVDAAALDRALGADACSWLAEAGILESTGSSYLPWFRLQVVDGIWILCDEPHLGHDAVMAPGPTTVHLLAAMPRRVTGPILDVGAGPGTFALVGAKRGAPRAVATDINPRAVALTRHNARFNELDVDVREGDLTAPVAGDRFAIVMAQPPYVTHPKPVSEVTFLHGGAYGDELALRLIGELPAVMAPGGHGYVLFDSPVRAEPLHDRARSMTGETGIDIAVLSAVGMPPDLQALGYGVLADPTFGEKYQETVLAYREHYEGLGVTKITHALVVLRARERPAELGWTIEIAVPDLPRTSEELASFIGGVDLATLEDDALVKARLRPRDRLLIVLDRKPGAKKDEVRRSVRFAGSSIASDRELSEAAIVILDLLARDPSVDGTIKTFAKAMEKSIEDVRPLVIDFVRECLARGLLVPA